LSDLLEPHPNKVGDHWEILVIGAISGGVVSRDGNYKTKEECELAIRAGYEKPVRLCNRCGVGIYEDWTTAEAPETPGGNCTKCGDDLCPQCSGEFDGDGECEICQEARK